MKIKNKKPKSKFVFPKTFKRFCKALKKTEKEIIKILLSPNGAVSCSPFDSKVGGIPYLLAEENWPVDSENIPLCFVAQVNFEEIPKLPNYPEKGILQFFNSARHGKCFGLCFDNIFDRSDYQVIFHNEIEPDVSKLKLIDSSMMLPEEIKKDPNFPFRISHCYKMTFDVGSQLITSQDFQIGKILPLDDEFDLVREYEEIYSKQMDHRDGQIGGYPYFCQEDPRTWNEEAKDYQLLFELNSSFVGLRCPDENAVDILWGDCGVANWFIKPSDLKDGNFQKVFFNIDCY